MPKVSVIIPAYNCARIIRDALASVFEQSLRDVEVIVVDDGSTDPLEDTLAPYTSSVTLLQQANQGPAAARNTGMDAAEGDYIAFLDADDIWLPQKLEFQVSLLDQIPRIGLVFCDGFRWIDGEDPWAGRRLSSLYAKPPSHPDIAQMFKINMVATSSVLFRRTLLKSVGPMNESVHGGEDFEFFIRLTAASTARYIDTPLMAYRVHEKNTSSKVSGSNVRVRIEQKLKMRHAALKSVHDLQRCSSIQLFSCMPSALQYLSLLFWRFRYGKSIQHTVSSILRYGKAFIK